MMHDMGTNWHIGFGFGHWFWGILIFALVVLAVFFLVKDIFNKKQQQ